jgi:hypothetical protein
VPDAIGSSSGNQTEARRINALPLAPHRPVLRFNTGPLFERAPDGKDLYKGEVIHAWSGAGKEGALVTRRPTGAASPPDR